MKQLRWYQGVLLMAGLALLCSCAALQDAQPRDRQGRLKVGDMAPDFELQVLEERWGRAEDYAVAVEDRKSKIVKLSSLRGKKPVVLIFGSYT